MVWLDGLDVPLSTDVNDPLYNQDSHYVYLTFYWEDRHRVNTDHVLDSSIR